MQRPSGRPVRGQDAEVLVRRGIRRYPSVLSQGVRAHLAQRPADGSLGGLERPRERRRAGLLLPREGRAQVQLRMSKKLFLKLQPWRYWR